jgi:hypothetical protein
MLDHVLRALATRGAGVLCAADGVAVPAHSEAALSAALTADVAVPAADKPVTPHRVRLTLRALHLTEDGRVKDDSPLLHDGDMWALKARGARSCPLRPQGFVCWRTKRAPHPSADSLTHARVCVCDSLLAPAQRAMQRRWTACLASTTTTPCRLMMVKEEPMSRRRARHQL